MINMKARSHGAFLSDCDCDFLSHKMGSMRCNVPRKCSYRDAFMCDVAFE